MALVPVPGQKPEEHKPDPLKRGRQGLSLAKTTLNVAKELKGGNAGMALNRAIIGGMKLASEYGVFYEPDASILELTSRLKTVGINALGWEPETLFAEIDRKYHNWTSERVAQALEYFNRTGMIDSDVPNLVRNKIHAIRLVATTDSPHTEWNVFEKVGGAFNDRVPHFGLVEPMSAAECARTIMLIENIRPDTYTDEVKIYIASCCQEDGLYTVEPIPALKMSEPFLEQGIHEALDEPYDANLKQQIIAKFEELKPNLKTLQEVPDDIASVQATKLLVIERIAEDAAHF